MMQGSRDTPLTAGHADIDDQEAGLKLDKVCLSLADRLLLSVDHLIAPGSVMTLMGPSGSGKSSLLNFICGFLDPAFKAAGDVRLNGKSLADLPPEQRSIGVLFQTPLLFPHLSVGQNLLAGLHHQKHSLWLPVLDRKHAAERRTIALNALADIGLPGFFEADPATLSGGQQARVALMRLLLSQPGALLLDEPFSSLDRGLRSEMRELTFSQARSRGLPVLLVTHDQEDAAASGGTLIELEDPQRA